MNAYYFPSARNNGNGQAKSSKEEVGKKDGVNKAI